MTKALTVERYTPPPVGTLAVLVQNTYQRYGETEVRDHYDSSEPLTPAGVIDRMLYHLCGGYDKPIKVALYRHEDDK